MMNRSNLACLMAVVFVCIGCSFTEDVRANPGASQNAAGVTLTVIGARNQTQDEAGTTLYEVEPGQHFKIVVVSSGATNSSAKPVIEGLDQFQSLLVNQSANLMNINGRVSNTTKFEYQLECKDEGTFVLGPAKINNVASSACSIRVRQRTQQESDRDFEHDYKRGVACQARLVAEKDSFFLGEDITVSLDIYCWDPGVDIEAIQPQFDGFTVKEQPHTIATASIDDRDVRIIQKKYVLSTMWAGQKKIKPVSLLYTTPVGNMDDDFPFGMMQGAFLFGPTRSVQKAETRTNGLEFVVKELPKSDRNPDGIGLFSSLTLSLDKNAVAPRMPINLSLKVSGKSDLGHITAPRLRLPKGLRSFPGTTESEITKNPASGEFEKRFTYVIQPLKAGNFKIPPQEFLYFDSEAGQYKTLTSQETMIVVESDEQEEHVQEQASPSNMMPDKQVKQASVAEDSLAEQPIPERHQSIKIPWALWYLLAACMLVLGFFYKHIQSWFAWHRRNPKKALRLAMHELEKPGKNEADQLFGVAIEYFSLRFFNGESAMLPLESVETVLERLNFPAIKRAEFMKFLTALAALAFTSSRCDVRKGLELREELKKWLTEIDRF